MSGPSDTAGAIQSPNDFRDVKSLSYTELAVAQEMCVECRAGRVCCQRRLNSALLGEQEQLTRGLFQVSRSPFGLVLRPASGESLEVFAESSSRLR